MTAKLIVTYTEELSGQGGQQTGLAYEVGELWDPLQAPAHVAAHRLVQNLGPEWVAVGPHPSPGRADFLAPGAECVFQRQGVLFASTVPAPPG